MDRLDPQPTPFQTSDPPTPYERDAAAGTAPDTDYGTTASGAAPDTDYGTTSTGAAAGTTPGAGYGTTPASGAATAPLGGVPSGSFDPWTYRDDSGVTGADLIGYKVEATDGGIGKIDSASVETNSSYLVVDTGPWIFGKKVMLPAGLVNNVDHDEQKVYVDRTKDQIKAAPEFDEAGHGDPAYRDKIGGYYRDSYGDGTSDVTPPQRLY